MWELKHVSNGQTLLTNSSDQPLTITRFVVAPEDGSGAIRWTAINADGTPAIESRQLPLTIAPGGLLQVIIDTAQSLAGDPEVDTLDFEYFSPDQHERTQIVL